MTLQRYELRHRIADMCDDLLLGTVGASPGSGTFVDTALEKPDDYFNQGSAGAQVFDYSGTGAGTSGTVTDWVNSTHTVTFKPAATLTADDKVEFHWRFDVAKYNRVINDAINMLKRWALKDIVDETLICNERPSGGTVIENCEDAWDESTASGVTSSADTSVYKIGSGSAKLVVAASVAANTILATELISSTNMNIFSHIHCWVRSTVKLEEGDLQLLLDDTASCASPLESLNIPVVNPYQWTWVRMEMSDAASALAIVSVGLKMVVDKGPFTVWIDDVRGAYYDGAVYEYSVPANFLYLGKVYLETATEGVFFGEPLVPRCWYIEEQTPSLVFRQEYYTPLDGRRLRLTGQQHRQAILSADTGTVDEEVADFICNQAAGSLLVSEEPTRANAYLARAAEEERRLRTHLHLGARRVRLV